MRPLAIKSFGFPVAPLFSHSKVIPVATPRVRSLGLVCAALLHGADGGGLVVAAVHLLLHDALLVQPLAGVVADLQEAAGLHHHVGLAGVGHDGVLRDHLGPEGRDVAAVKSLSLRQTG